MAAANCLYSLGGFVTAIYLVTPYAPSETGVMKQQI